MLLYYFGSKEQLVAHIHSAVIDRIVEQSSVTLLHDDDLRDSMMRLWREAGRQHMQPLYRSVVEVWSKAVVSPQKFRPFLLAVGRPWNQAIKVKLRRSGWSDQDAAVRAVLAIATFQGLQLMRLMERNDRRATAALKLMLDGLLTQSPSRLLTPHGRSVVQSAAAADIFPKAPPKI